MRPVRLMILTQYRRFARASRSYSRGQSATSEDVASVIPYFLILFACAPVRPSDTDSFALA